MSETNKNKDRHRPGYWKERWAKQKAAKAAAEADNPKPKKKKKVKKDRHRPGYYHDYNQAHPERLNRGFTKGYKNGNVSDGVIEKKEYGLIRHWVFTFLDGTNSVCLLQIIRLEIY